MIEFYINLVKIDEHSIEHALLPLKKYLMHKKRLVMLCLTIVI